MLGICNFSHSLRHALSKYAVDYVYDILAKTRIYNQASFNRYVTYDYFMSQASLDYFTLETYEFIAWCLIHYSSGGLKD